MMATSAVLSCPMLCYIVLCCALLTCSIHPFIHLSCLHFLPHSFSLSLSLSLSLTNYPDNTSRRAW